MMTFVTILGLAVLMVICVLVLVALVHESSKGNCFPLWIGGGEVLKLMGLVIVALVDCMSGR